MTSQDNTDYGGRSEFSEIETLVRSAGDYVSVSEDLRPKVLDAARRERRKKHLVRKTCAMAGLVLLIAAVSGVASHQLQDTLGQSSTPSRLARLQSSEYGSNENHLAPRRAEVGVGWRLIEALFALRREHADAIGPKKISSAQEAEALRPSASPADPRPEARDEPGHERLSSGELRKNPNLAAQTGAIAPSN